MRSKGYRRHSARGSARARPDHRRRRNDPCPAAATVKAYSRCVLARGPSPTAWTAGHGCIRTALLAAAAAVMVTSCSGPGPHAGSAGKRSARAAASAASATDAPTRSPSPSPSVIAIPPAAPGLPQTTASPSATAPVFADEMTDLWTAIVTGNTTIALQSFFPLAAYQQVKAIGDPTTDWQSRLVGEYVLDIQAAHAYLGPSASAAQLVQVIVPSQYASWIVPGDCYNKVGYWHVPGSRLVYRVDGELRSIGVASLISWRGQWYVVHLGGVTRTTTGGMVDDPESGPGTAGPPGGC